MTKSKTRSLRIAIIGGGPGGICMGIKLKQAGFDDFVILEKGQGVGGTWYHNSYPGCACDLPSALYSFSFEIKKDWSRPYAPQPEILQYMQGVAEKYGILAHCRFGAEVTSARWDDAAAKWNIEFGSGERLEADAVVSAMGMFNELVFPKSEGLDQFAGTRWHSGRWNWEHDLSGETVGVIGSAASAVQFVPEIMKRAKQVYLYQRSANWVLPKEDTPYTEEQLEHLRNDPDAARAIRDESYRRVDQGMCFLDPEANAMSQAAGVTALEEVKDQALRANLTPTHPFGCKRPLISNDFYAAFNGPGLELVTEPIERITANAVVSGDGRERPIDTLITATGFEATKYLSAIEVVGRGGVHINDAWAEGAAAYLGITTAGFPNLFMLYGPNTNNGSILYMLECQADYATLQLQRLAQEGLAWLDVRPEPMADYNTEIQQAIDRVPVWTENCNTYYRSKTGRVVTQWPHSMTEFRTRTSKRHDDAYEIG